MVTLEWDVERVDGVTLVGLFVESERTCRVRIENRLDGPVWPPRRRGQPASGWDGDEFTGVVPGDGRLSVGYSTTAPPAEPPAEVVATEPVDEEAGTDATSTPPATNGSATDGIAPDVEATSSGVIRSLGDPVVPRDCVPIPERNGTGPRGNGTDDRTGPENPRNGRSRDGRSRDEYAASNGQCRDDRPSSNGQHRDERVATNGEKRDDRTAVNSGRSSVDGGSDPGPRAGPSGEALVVPGAVRSWLRDVERRVDAVENRRESYNAPRDERTSGDPDLSAAVAADRRALAWLADRVDALSGRADVRGERARDASGRKERARGDRTPGGRTREERGR